MKRLLKQLSVALTVASILALPVGVTGCAQEAPTTDETSATDTDTSAEDVDTETDLGEPEAGSEL